MRSKVSQSEARRKTGRRPRRKNAAPPNQAAAETTSSKRPNLGERVRQIRRENNWTLQDLSSKTGVGTSTLSKLENGLIDVNFETVMKICEGLDLSLEHLTNHEQASFRSGVRSVTRRSEGLRLSTHAYGYEVLCTDVAKKGLLPVVVTVKARSLGQVEHMSQHPGEEFVYVIKGRLELHTEFYGPTVLEEGDSAYYDSSGPHAFVNVADGETLVLSVSRDSTGKHRGATGHLDSEF